MMGPLARAAELRLLAVVALCASLLGGAVLWYVTVHDGGAQVVAESPQPGWKTIQYQGVKVDIPSAWERTDMDDCEFEFEHWAPPGAADCGMGGGVAFYASATFDPAHGPGVIRNGATQGARWGGYTDTGELAVYVSDSDRALVRRVLNSTR
jgi:hypothetical protein